MVNFGMFHLLDRAKTAGFNAAMTSLLQQPWVVFSCQIQTAADKQLRVSTLQFATAEGEVYIFDCISLGTQAIHEHGLAWLLQSPSVKKIMYSSNNTAMALWRQLKVQIDGAVDLQILSAMPQQWPILPPGSNKPLTDAINSSAWTPAPVTGRADKRPQSFNGSVRTVSVDASSRKSGHSGQESPQAVLDLMLDDLETDAMQSPDLVYSFAKDAAAGQKPDCGGQPKPRGRCSSMGSMSLLDSMQLMELPILPEEDGSVAEEYMDNKMDEGERFNWLKRPLPSDALDYAAAEAKTILRLYQQVSKDSKTAGSIMDTQSSIQTVGETNGPLSPYKQQQSDRRRLLSESSIAKLCPVPVPAKQVLNSSKKAASGGSAASKPAKVKKNKSSSWRMPCLS